MKDWNKGLELITQCMYDNESNPFMEHQEIVCVNDDWTGALIIGNTYKVVDIRGKFVELEEINGLHYYNRFKEIK